MVSIYCHIDRCISEVFGIYDPIGLVVPGALSPEKEYAFETSEFHSSVTSG